MIVNWIDSKLQVTFTYFINSWVNKVRDKFKMSGKREGEQAISNLQCVEGPVEYEEVPDLLEDLNLQAGKI